VQGVLRELIVMGVNQTFSRTDSRTKTAVAAQRSINSELSEFQTDRLTIAGLFNFRSFWILLRSDVDTVYWAGQGTLSTANTIEHVIEETHPSAIGQNLTHFRIFD